jgi:hypothetical protein
MAVLTLYPYLIDVIWVFDDPRTGLKEEAFVLGASEMIHRIVSAKRIPKASEGFALSFSAEPFDHDVELSWQDRDDLGQAVLGDQQVESVIAGNWYAGDVAGEQMQCWLCPALFLYFAAAPKKIYVKAEPLPAGINPIWGASPDERMRRFVSGETKVR